MKTTKSILSALVLSGTLGLGYPATADERFLVKEVAIDEAGYCHMQFATISEETLASNRPALGMAGTVDVIDFYGSCDYDPLGKEEILEQRAERHQWHDDDNDS